MATLSAAHVLTCKGRASKSETRPLVTVCLVGNGLHLTPTQFQHQYLIARHGMRPALAVIAAELVFGGEGMMRLLPNDQRRAALSAGLLASEHDGEVVAAARALVGLLRKGNLDPASVVSAGLTAVSAPPVMADRHTTCAPHRPMSVRAKMAQCAPNLNDWERGFLNDVGDRRGLSERQERMLRSILAKAERGDA